MKIGPFIIELESTARERIARVLEGPADNMRRYRRLCGGGEETERVCNIFAADLELRAKSYRHGDDAFTRIMEPEEEL